jgi:pseudouridine-5'-phosphate glycosidase/pseudouridine kinase
MEQGIAGKRIHGGTTISGTMVLSHLAGIKIFGTGGLGTLVIMHEDFL